MTHPVEPDQAVPIPSTALVKRRRWIGGIAFGAVLLSGVGIAAGQFIKSPAQALADSSAPPPSVLTAPVEYRVLTASVMLRGTVTAAQSVDVAPAGSGEGGSAVVTKLPVKAGQPVAAGRVLLEVSGRPVFTLEGAVPVYRDLKPGADGDDVAQLQKALRGVGHGTGGDRNGHFGPGTKTALAAFYRSIGYDPLPAQPDGDSSVESAQEAVTSADRAVEDARDALRTAQDPAVAAAPSAGTPSSSQAPSSQAGREGAAVPDEPGQQDGAGAGSPAELRKQVTRAEEDLAKARTRLTEVQETVGPMLPASEVVFLTRFPARVDSVDVQVGATVSGKVMTVSAGELMVRGYLAPHEKGLVRRGRPVEILSEVTGLSVPATVASVSETMTAEHAAGDDGTREDAGAQTSGYPMVVEPTRKLPGELAGQDVRLTVRAASTKGKTLVVPLSAISAGADGRTAVTVVGGNGAQHRVPVSTGTTGDGYVEIHPLEGLPLRAGERVITGVQSTGTTQSSGGVETGQ
ncbi:peptidoglycan-binding protein [Streptomyces sp. NPDC058231]|uniref:peptidoglycan-binding protein n=1 Tax=Streptomyces sp. NPDC058231 TaxID=3346392 RepID=UPI0036E4F4FD